MAKFVGGAAPKPDPRNSPLSDVPPADTAGPPSFAAAHLPPKAGAQGHGEQLNRGHIQFVPRSRARGVGHGHVPVSVKSEPFGAAGYGRGHGQGIRAAHGLMKAMNLNPSHNSRSDASSNYVQFVPGQKGHCDQNEEIVYHW